MTGTTINCLVYWFEKPLPDLLAILRRSMSVFEVDESGDHRESQRSLVGKLTILVNLDANRTHLTYVGFEMINIVLIQYYFVFIL